MLLKNFIICNVIFAHQAIFNTLYIGKSSGKQDHYDLGVNVWLVTQKRNFLKMYPGYQQEIWKLVRLDL